MLGKEQKGLAKTRRGRKVKTTGISELTVSLYIILRVFEKNAKLLKIHQVKFLPCLLFLFFFLNKNPYAQLLSTRERLKQTNKKYFLQGPLTHRRKKVKTEDNYLGLYRYFLNNFCLF